MTDANLVLGRLIPDYFPHIFGESEDQPLDKARATAAFRTLTQQVCILPSYFAILGLIALSQGLG